MIWIFTTVVYYGMKDPPSVCVCEGEHDEFLDGSHIALIMHPLISTLSQRSLGFVINSEITTIRSRPTHDPTQCCDRAPHPACRHLSLCLRL